MPLIKNPEFMASEIDSPHLKIGRITFGSKSPVIADRITRLAIYSEIQEGLIDEIASVGIELKPRPTERLTFEVVSELPDDELATLYTIGLPMQAIRNAGIPLNQLVSLEAPTLVSTNRNEDPLKNYIDTAMHAKLWSLAGGVALGNQTESAPTPLLSPVPTEIAVPEAAPAFAHAA